REPPAQHGDGGGQWEGEVAQPEDGGDRESLCETLRLLQMEVPAGSERWCSRNVLRKQRHWERIVMAKKKKRKQEKERRKAKPAEDKGTRATPHQSKRVLKATARERLLAAKEAAPRLCIDLSMSSRMTKKHLRVPGAARRWPGATGPVDAARGGAAVSRSSAVADFLTCCHANDTRSCRKMDTTPESYLDLFPVERIVYLTPDSENALRDVDPHKVYVLGGLVDETIQKERSLQQAQGHALQTARLPIAEYMVRNANARNYHSETLAINQVCDALVTYCATRSWPEALKAAVPPGKGYVLREPAT
uniref:tRNA (guanine(9)-N(1))-methyltransferase n=1 Tax=Pelodiscus sinensis TaxID=13735 RepID=K7F613_PELSI